MDTYFESVNDWGSAQISDAFANYVLWKRGVVYSGIGQAAYSQMWVISDQLPAGGARAIVVLEPPQGVAPLMLFQRTEPGAYNSRIYSTDVYTMGQRLDYYIMIPSNDPAIALAGTGLFCIWDKDGKLIYDSDAPYLKVLEYREHYYNQGAYSKDFGTGRRLGVVVSQPQWFIDSVNMGGGWKNLAGTSAYSVNGKITFDYMLFRRTTSGNQWPSPGTGANPGRPPMCKILVCDLTKMDELPLNL